VVQNQSGNTVATTTKGDVAEVVAVITQAPTASGEPPKVITTTFTGTDAAAAAAAASSALAAVAAQGSNSSAAPLRTGVAAALGVTLLTVLSTLVF